MEFIYNNKFIVSIFLGLSVSILFFNYNKINHDNIDKLTDEQQLTNVNNDNRNKDYSLYIFLIVSVLTFMILNMTQDNINDVFEGVTKLNMNIMCLNNTLNMSEISHIVESFMRLEFQPVDVHVKIVDKINKM